MTAQETERLARVEEQIINLTAQLTENTKDTKAIREVLDNLTGGKQALMWITGIAVSIGVIIATVIGSHHK